MLNEDQIKGKWTEIRGGIRNLWGKVTDDELDQARGNFTKIAGIIQEKYGESKEAVKSKLDQLMDSFDNETDRSKQNLSSSSYQRNPTAEDNVDADFGGDSNFSVGRDINEGDSRGFNSSSSVMNSSSDFEDEEENSFDADQDYGEHNDDLSFQNRSRGNITNMDEDRNARH